MIYRLRVRTRVAGSVAALTAAGKSAFFSGTDEGNGFLRSGLARIPSTVFTALADRFPMKRDKLSNGKIKWL